MARVGRLAFLWKSTAVLMSRTRASSSAGRSSTTPEAVCMHVLLQYDCGSPQVVHPPPPPSCMARTFH